jgi:hypothetical protein
MKQNRREGEYSIEWLRKEIETLNRKMGEIEKLDKELLHGVEGIANSFYVAKVTELLAKYFGIRDYRYEKHD